MSALKSAGYFLQRFALRRPYLTAKSGVFDLKFRVKTEDVVGRHIYKYGRHEPELTDYLLDTLAVEDGDVLIDVGANIGWFSLLFDRLAGTKNVTVLSFEPDPLNFGLLTENIRLNNASHVNAQALALSDTEGTAVLHLFPDSNRGRHSVLPLNDGETVEIPTARLDDVWQNLGLGDRVPRLLKIDVEGYELIALRGASNVLARCPMLILEFSPRYMKKGGIEPRDLVDLLTAQGFRPYQLNTGRLEQADLEALLADDRHCDLVLRREPV